MAKRGPAAGESWRDVIPESNLYATGYYDMEVEEPKVGYSKNGNKQYTATGRITAPDEFKGQPYFIRFTVGNEKDPEAEDPNSWKSFSARQMRQFLDACEAPDCGLEELDKLWEKDVEGLAACAHLGQRTQTKGDYAGEQQQTEHWYKIGDREPGLIGADTGGGRRRHEPAAEPTDEPPRRGRREPEPEPEEPPRRAARR